MNAAPRNGHAEPLPLRRPPPWINSPDVTFSPIALRARAGDLEVILAVRPPDRPSLLAEAGAPPRALQPVAEPTELSVGVVVIGDVRLDRRSREVHLRTDEIRLEPAEFDVLAMLMDHAGRLVTTSDLVQTIWPDDVPPPSRAPDVHIAALRRKLDHPVNVPSHISTIRGIGYRFETG